MAVNTDPLAAIADQYESHGPSFALGPAEFYRCRRRSDGAPMLGALFDLSELEPGAAAEIPAAVELWDSASFPGWRPIQTHPVSETLFVVMTEDPGGVGFTGESGEVLRVSPIRAVHLGVELARAVAHIVDAGFPVPVLPPHLLREVPGGGVVVLHAWILPILPWLLRLGSSESTVLPASIPPEADGGGAFTSRTAVFAVASLMRQLLPGPSPAGGERGGGIGLSPGLERVLRHATNRSARLRQAGLRQLSQELVVAGPANRRNFIPVPRRPARRRQRRFVPRRRAYLPPRPVPELPGHRVKPWMIALVAIAGIVTFLALVPRFGNPLGPIEDTMIEFRSAFSDPEPTDADVDAAVGTGRLILVPDFTGRQQAEVQVEAARLDIELAVQEEVAPDVAPGTVIRQEPEAGARVRAGAMLTVFVGRGEASAFLIGVQNRTALDAREALTELGFVVVEVPVFDKDRPAGIVLGQSPDPGQVLPKGTQVVIQVSRGAQRLAIPSVVGLPEEDALRIITDLGLNVAIEEVPDAALTYQPGEVVAQQPGAGSSVEPGATVVLRVYKPEPITVPNLVGLELGQALLALDAAGLAPGIVRQLPAEEDQTLVVISQSLPAGSPAARNVVVDFQLGPQ
jgi:beta-lactam-binding protein with PASTA domain